jgi:hypothetical protein
VYVLLESIGSLLMCRVSSSSRTTCQAFSLTFSIRHVEVSSMFLHIQDVVHRAAGGSDALYSEDTRMES